MLQNTLMSSWIYWLICQEGYCLLLIDPRLLQDMQSLISYNPVDVDDDKSVTYEILKEFLVKLYNRNYSLLPFPLQLILKSCWNNYVENCFEIPLNCFLQFKYLIKSRYKMFTCLFSFYWFILNSFHSFFFLFNWVFVFFY